MKRINILLSEELAARVERLAQRREMSVADIARRSLEIYLVRFPEKAERNTRIPVVNLGKQKKKDIKKEIYSRRMAQIVG